MVTVIMICITWFIVSKRDKTRAKENKSTGIEDDGLVTPPYAKDGKR